MSINLSHTIALWYLEKHKLKDAAFPKRDCLSAEEQQRALQFSFVEDSESFITWHVLKRLILARYLNQSPQNIAIKKHPHGKPFIEGSSVYFNLSHTKNMAVLAVTENHDIGVDIESVERVNDFLALAQRFFHPQEYLDLTQICDLEDRRNYFFRLWTAKEAILKATGEGIRNGLDQFYIKPHTFKKDTVMSIYSKKITLMSLEDIGNCLVSLALIDGSKSVTYCDVFREGII